MGVVDGGVDDGVVVSVVKVTAVVEASVTMIAVVDVTTVSGTDVVELLTCLFLRYSFTMASCLARSTNLDASSGSSLWIASIATCPSSKMPSRYLGFRLPSNAAFNDSPGSSFNISSHSATVEGSNSLSSTCGSGRANDSNGRPRRKMDRKDGIFLLLLLIRSKEQNRCLGPKCRDLLASETNDLGSGWTGGQARMSELGRIMVV